MSAKAEPQLWILSLTGSMSTWEALEPAIEQRLIGRTAYGWRHQNPSFFHICAKRGNNMIGEVCGIRIASRDQIRARFAKDILHSLGDDVVGRHGQSQTHPRDYRRFSQDTTELRRIIDLLFHSQSLRRHNSPRGAPTNPCRPGTKMRHITMITMPGTITPTIPSI